MEDSRRDERESVEANAEALQWVASQMRGKRRSNRTLMAMVASVIGAAAVPLVQLPNVLDIGMM